jgi:hypothetical protein
VSKSVPEWVTQEGWAPTCSFLTFQGSMRNMEPPEFCDNDVVPGTELCPLHTEPEEDPADPDEPDYLRFQECYESDFDTDALDDDYILEWH